MIGVTFDCGDCIQVEDRDLIEQAMDDHDTTCNECPTQAEREFITDLHAHRSSEQIDVRCGQYFRFCDAQERAQADPDYELPVSGDILATIRSNR